MQGKTLCRWLTTILQEPKAAVGNTNHDLDLIASIITVESYLMMILLRCLIIILRNETWKTAKIRKAQFGVCLIDEVIHSTQHACSQLSAYAHYSREYCSDSLKSSVKMQTTQYSTQIFAARVIIKRSTRRMIVMMMSKMLRVMMMPTKIFFSWGL